MTVNRKSIEDRIAPLMEAAVDEQSIMRILGSEGTDDTVLDQIVAISEEYRKEFEEKHPELLLSGRDLEDKGAHLLGLPPTDELLKIGMHIEQFRRQMIARLHISTEELIALQESSIGKVANHENLIVVDQVHTPPDFSMWMEGEGDGDPMIIEFVERLTAFRYLLYSLGLDPNDPKQVIMQMGRVGENMMRRVSYVSVLVKPLNRLVELCNQVGNRSFIWKTNKSEDIEYFASMGKEEKKTLLDEDQDRGWDIVMSKGWLERMRVCLEVDSSAVQPHKVRAPRILEDMRDAEQAADIVRSILEAEGVLHIDEREENGKKVRVLVWDRKINPNIKYHGHDFPLKSFIGSIISSRSDQKLYQSFSSILDPIRSLYIGMFDREEAGNSDMAFELADTAHREEMIRTLLEAEGVLRIDTREENGKPMRVLFWQKTIYPQNKYSNYSSSLATLLRRVRYVSDGNVYVSFASVIDPIRSLYVGRFDNEKGVNSDMQFKIANLQQRKQMVCSLLESEGVLRIDTREEDGKFVRVLIWENEINPMKKCVGYELNINILLGRAFGIGGNEGNTSFASIIDPIRNLYSGRFDREEAGNPDIEFKFADVVHRAEMLRSLLEAEGVLNIETHYETENPVRVLVWQKLFNPRKRLKGYRRLFNSLLGEITGVSGNQYLSYSSVLDPIRSLYTGMYEREEWRIKKPEEDIEGKKTQKIQ